MRIYIAGQRGQLGRALTEALAGHTLAGGDLPELDIADYGAVRRIVGDFAPDVVVNAAAYTDTAGCERDPDLAYRVNALGVQSLALACAATGAALLHISTNEVFDGQQKTPYRELDSPNPLNTYARSKLAGEWYAQRLCPRFYIVRTAWLYGQGASNFIHRITRLADERGSLSVVTDEVATPTSVLDLAQAIARLLERPMYGIYHLTNSGYCSRFEWTRRILELTGRSHILLATTTLSQFASATPKPPYSVLDNFCGASLGITLRPWEEALADFLTLPPGAPARV